MHNNHCHRVTAQLQLINIIIIIIAKKIRTQKENNYWPMGLLFDLFYAYFVHNVFMLHYL